MLILARSLRELSFRGLMDIYIEGNQENGEELWPGLSTNEQVLRAEQDFYQYLRENFFTVPGAVYAVWEESGRYISALRLEPYKDGLLLEALETVPELRRQGYAEKLIRAVQARCGGTKIYSHVGKWNEASLGAHKKCGFRRILSYAAYIDGSVNNRSCTMVYGG